MERKEKEIEIRVRKYLERDSRGVRAELLKLMLSGEKFTTNQIYAELRKKGFEIKMRGVSAMVGLMSARLGIIKMELGNRNRYFLKPEYSTLVARILDEHLGKQEEVRPR
jgi:Fe2+ or Zn2+ uptake regulation protein